jgi:hypothetical protein
MSVEQKNGQDAPFWYNPCPSCGSADLLIMVFSLLVVVGLLLNRYRSAEAE